MIKPRFYFIGEFSGLFSGMSEGLRSLGLQCVTVSSGDGFKSISADSPLPRRGPGLLGAVRYAKAWRDLAEAVMPHDVVNFISATAIPIGGWPLLARLRRRGVSIVFWAAGDDAVYFKQGPRYKYWPYSGEGVPDSGIKGRARIWIKTHVPLRYADAIVPVMYDYAEAYRSSPYRDLLTETVPLPCLTRWMTDTARREGSVLRVYHGATRRGFKGSDVIEAAFRRCQQRFGSRVQFEIGQGRSLHDYEQYLAGVSILVDQCKSYSYAMNALLGMAKGCVVLAPASSECLRELRVPECPVVHIEPSITQVENAIVTMVQSPEARSRRSVSGLNFVKTSHAPIVAAEKYLRVLSSKQLL